jgi:hypothetical protein
MSNFLPLLRISEGTILGGARDHHRQFAPRNARRDSPPCSLWPLLLGMAHALMRLPTYAPSVARPVTCRPNVLLNPSYINFRQEGHLSAICSSIHKQSKPFWAGYGRNGVAFVCCEALKEELWQLEFNAMSVYVESGNLLEEQVEDEFESWFSEQEFSYTLLSRSLIGASRSVLAFFPSLKQLIFFISLTI